MFTPIIDPLTIVRILLNNKIVPSNEKFILSNINVDKRYITTSSNAISNPFAPICFPTYIDTMKKVNSVHTSNIVFIVVSFVIVDDKNVKSKDSIKLKEPSNNIDEIVILIILFIVFSLWWCLIICMSSC